MTAGEGTAGAITRLLRAHREGDRAAFDELVRLVHPELRVMARQQLRRLPPDAMLDTVGLVNEAWLRLVGDVDVDWQGRAHFFAVVARAMRWIAVDHARRASAGKRGGEADAVPLDTAVAEALAAAGGFAQAAETVLAVHAALERLESFQPRLAQLVECRFFAGMEEAEAAAALGVSLRTVQRDWMRARAWLQAFLAGGADGPA